MGNLYLSLDFSFEDDRRFLFTLTHYFKRVLTIINSSKDRKNLQLTMINAAQERDSFQWADDRETRLTNKHCDISRKLFSSLISEKQVASQGNNFLSSKFSFIEIKCWVISRKGGAYWATYTNSWYLWEIRHRYLGYRITPRKRLHVDWDKSID